MRSGTSTRSLKKHLQYKIPQIRLALIKESGRGPFARIQTPEDLGEYLEPMKMLPDEQFVSLHLDVHLQIIGFQVVSHGTISSSLVHPREVFKAALLSNAHSLVVAHNHPSGSRYASEDDWNTTKQLIEAGEIIGVKLLDHLIVTDSGIISLRQERPAVFEK